MKTGALSESGPGNAILGAYLSQLGLSEKAILYITHAAPTSMQWMGMEEAAEYGITVSKLPLADAGLGSGFSNVVMQVGGALGLASITSISTSSAEGTGTFQLAYVLAAIAVAAALAVTVAVLRSAPAVQPAHESVHLEEAA